MFMASPSPNGLTLASIAPALYFDQLIGRKEVQFDWTKFTWIGSPEQIDELLFIRADAPYKTLEDIRKAADPPKCAATGPASATYYFPKLLEEVFGLKFNIVIGYPGGAEADLAIDKGEDAVPRGVCELLLWSGTWPHLGQERVRPGGRSSRVKT